MQPTDHTQQVCPLHHLHPDLSMPPQFLVTQLILIVLNAVQLRFVCRDRGKKVVGRENRKQVLGCELLESRVVMEITAGEAEGIWRGRTRPFRPSLLWGPRGREDWLV